MNFFDFDSFSQICPIFRHSPLFCAVRTDLSWKAINLWREHKNDGEWWKDRTNLWKAVKIKEIREKTPFLSNAEKSSPHQYNTWGLNWLGTVCPEEPINWGPIVGDQMSGDHMCLGPNVSQPFDYDLK